MLYWPIVGFLWVIAHVFFRRIEVVGLEHIPEDKPIIFVGNHPNSLVDPVLMLTHCGRRVRFAAKDTLFKNPVWKVVFSMLGAVPIKRRQDHKGSASVDNRSAFEALFEVLREKGAFGIFPEGISYTRPEMAPLKTGAARIALNAAKEGLDVSIVPCGLSYRRRDRLRSRVLIQFGEPLDVVDLPRSNDESNDARTLTAQIASLLRALTINAASFETLRVLDGVRRLYRPARKKLSLHEQAEITRRFIEHYERLEHEPAVIALHGEVESYLNKLNELSLTDRDLLKPLSRASWFWRVVRSFFFTFIMVPFALPGALVHAPVLILAVFAGRAGGRLLKRADVVATTKMASATFLVVLTYSLIIAAIAWWFPFPQSVLWSVLTLVGLLFSGWALIRVLERQSQLRKSISILKSMMHLKEEIVALRAERDRLRLSILNAVDTFMDAGLERIIHHDEHEELP